MLVFACLVRLPSAPDARYVNNLLVMELRGYVKLSPDVLDATFFALADPTRRAILARLARSEASVAELAAPFDMSQPAISKHLRVLERAGLVSRGREAQRRPARLEVRRLEQAEAWLADYRRIWEANYARLDALLAELKSTRTAPRRRNSPPRPT